VHNASIAALRKAKGPILVEKPLCYSERELDEWVALDRERDDRGRVFVLHNYRYKANVSAMLEHLERYNPGRLHHVEVAFQSPSVNKDVPWRRAERRARTLLMDYALHFVDLACMFNAGRWDVEHCRHETNRLDQTSLIEAALQSSTYGVNIVLRQGFMPRRCRLFYTFENYGVSLSFFPDTFVPHQTFDSWTLHKWEGRRNFRATIAKVVDKLAKRDRDESHALALAGAAGIPELATSMSLPRLEQFYRAVFRLADRVYG
jgi:predicted dehydrogenase